MSRLPLRVPSDGPSFPRVSGDEPKIIQGLIDGIKFSPRERG